MVCTVAFAQQLTVKGVVKQPDGETVIGATVTEKGTTNATVTDLLSLSPPRKARTAN